MTLLIDSEVLAMFFTVYGITHISLLQGEFAFIFYDPNSNYN
jgi:hypothetical protein